jgi:general secretion pathway protein C
MDIRHWFLRYSFVVNMALVALIAYLAARTTNSVVANTFFPAGKTEDAKVARRQASPTRSQAPTESIVSRDLFDAKKPAPGLDASVVSGDSAEVKPTELRLSLLGVAFFGDKSSMNIATIKNKNDQKISLFRAGDQVFDQAKVYEVKLDRVILDLGNGSLEELMIENLNKPPPNLRATYDPYEGVSQDDREKSLALRRNAIQRRLQQQPPSVDLSGRIKQVGENSFVIQKTAIDETLANMNSIITQARLIPNFVGEGETRTVDGFRIYRIQQGSIFSSLGLQNGDVIKSINGDKMDSVEKGLQLLQSLKNETKFNLDIERQSKPVNYKYEVE